MDRNAARAALERELAEKDVNAVIKMILSEVEIAARTLPVESCHPYEADRRRKVIIRAVWGVFRRAQQVTAAED